MRLYHRIIIIAIAFLYCLEVNAQDVVFSEVEKTNGTAEEVQVIGKLKDKIVCYTNIAGNAQLIWYTLDMQRLGYTELNFFSKSIEHIDLSIMDNEVHIFYQVKARKMVYLYATKLFDTDKSFEPMLVDSVETQGMFDKQRFSISHNLKGKKHFYALVRNLPGLDKLYINHTVLNSNFTLVNKYETALDVDKRYELVETNVDKQGRFFSIIGELRRAKKNYEELALLTKGPRDEQVTNIAIDLKNYSYSGMKSSFDATESNLYIGGLFHKSRGAEPEGVVALVFNSAQNSIVQQHVAPIIVQSFDGNNALTHLILRNIRVKADGGFEIVAEKSFVESRNMGSMGMMSPLGGMSPGGNRIEKVYMDDDIYIFNMKPDGTLGWTQSIIKKQESRMDYGVYSSFATLAHPMGAVYLFNDGSGRTRRLLTSYISNNGELSLKQLSSSVLENNDDKQFILRGAQQVSKDVLIAPAISKGDLSFVKISF